MLENGFLEIAGFYGTMQNSVQPRFSRSIFHDFGKCEKHRPNRQSNNCFTFNAQNNFSFFSCK